MILTAINRMIYLVLIFSIIYGEISEGYTLFSPLPNQSPSNGYKTYLINNNETILITPLILKIHEEIGQL